MTQSLPPVPRAVLVWLIISLCLGVMLLAVVTNVFAGHLHPGCENQELRPRLTGCCPRHFSGETLPPQCRKWEVSGHLAVCCGPAPSPSIPPCYWTQSCGEPTPVNTATPCFNGYDFVPCPEATTCAGPTPLPTPVSHQKGECCREVQRIYRDARLDIVDRKTVALKALIRWKKTQMGICRGGY